MTNTPISGLAIGIGFTSGRTAADNAGDVFASIPSGPNSGLVKVPAAGGAVQQLDSATYSQLTII